MFRWSVNSHLSSSATGWTAFNVHGFILARRPGVRRFAVRNTHGTGCYLYLPRQSPAHSARQHVSGTRRALPNHDEGRARHLESAYVDLENDAVLDTKGPQTLSAQESVRKVLAKRRHVPSTSMQDLQIATPSWPPHTGLCPANWAESSIARDGRRSQDHIPSAAHTQRSDHTEPWAGREPVSN